MKPSELAANYDLLAQRWADPAFDRTNGILPHRRALQFARSRGHAIDIGCGSSGRFLDLLVAAGFEAEGLDLSAEMIRLARLRTPGLVFHHADICQWVPPRRYDFITAWDSIWHVPRGEQSATLGKLCAALAPGGIFIFTAGGLDEPGETQDAHMGVPMYHATLGIPQILRLLDEAGCTCRHLEFDQVPGPHVYFIAQRRD